jgi:hypothetical protein
MLRKLREQWWYILLWLPLGTFLGLLAVWLWITFHIIGGWTIQSDAAPKWGFFSAGALVFLVLWIAVLFPRKPARHMKIAMASVSLTALLLCVLFYANTRAIVYEVNDVDGGPLEDIPIHITHHANGVALTWFPGEKLLRTDKQGKATIRIFRSEQCDANLNDLLGQRPGFGNSKFSCDNAFFIPIEATVRDAAWLFGTHGLVEHSYMLEFQKGPPSVSQRCLESPLYADSGIIPIYLRRRDSTTLPPYFDQILKEDSANPIIQQARVMSLGGSIESFNHLDELLADVSRDDPLQDSALFSLDFLATQVQHASKQVHHKKPTRGH